MRDLLYKLKWILSQSRQAILYICLIIIFGSLVSLMEVWSALISKYLIDSATLGEYSSIIKLVVLLGLTIFGSTILSSLNSLLSTYCTTKISNSIQQKIYAHVTYAEWSQLSKYHSVNILSRITSDVGVITTTLITTLPNLISYTIMLLASFYTLLKLDYSMAIMAITIIPIFLIVSKLLSKSLKKIHIDLQNQDIKYKSFIQETLQNSIIVKTFCSENENINKLNDMQNRKLSLQMKSSLISSLSNFSLSLSGSIGYFLVFCWGSTNLSNGASNFGTLTAMIQLFSNVQAPMYIIARSFPQIIKSIASAERLIELENFDTECNISNSSELINKPAIKFDSVKFGYTDHNIILNNITCSINNGDIVGLVGPSGQGKTTILRLLLSLIQPYSGNISIVDSDTKDSTFINRSHREYISYIPQGNTLFSGTIRENLLYGNINANIEDIKEACILAYAWDFIQELDNNLDTIIGEKGLGLSEGQAQRISIARAFLRKKPILILDDATSALDSTTELNILKSIKNLKHKPTCIIITHRPSSINICNRVLMLEGGNIKEIDKDYVENISLDLS